MSSRFILSKILGIFYHDHKAILELHMILVQPVAILHKHNHILVRKYSKPKRNVPIRY